MPATNLHMPKITTVKCIVQRLGTTTVQPDDNVTSDLIIRHPESP